MLVDYNKFQEISKDIDYDYFSRGLPFGCIRIYAIDDDGIEHSLVLTKKEFKKYFNLGDYKYLFTTLNTPEIRLVNIKPWYTYDQFDKMSCEQENVFILDEDEKALLKLTNTDKTYEQIRQEDELFHKLYQHFLDFRDKYSWDIMFALIRETCISSMKKKGNGIQIPDLEEKALDATINCMRRLRKEIDKGITNIPEKLATLVYSYCLFPLYDPKVQFFEKQLSYEGLTESYGDLFNENIEENE